MLKKHDFSDSFMMNLAGNSFVGHCFAAVLAAVLLHWPGPAALPEPPERAEHLAEATRSDSQTVDEVTRVLGIGVES
eukprot:8889509-Pyramimonas_sp.AAC.1